MAKAKKLKKTVTWWKKKVWKVFSEYIRLRDALNTTGSPHTLRCCSCGKPYPAFGVGCAQAGHFIPGRHNSILFSEHCVHGQCYNCNINLYGNTLEYRRRIIEMYGDGYDEVLEQEDRRIKKFTRQELEEMKIDLKAKIKALTDGE